MTPKLLIMSSSKQQNPKEGVMPALLRFNSLRWQVLRGLLLKQGTPILGLRILVLTPSKGFISVSQPIEYDDYAWTGSTWRKDLPKIHESYNRVVRSRIDPGSNIFVSADAIHQAAMNACGLQQDVVLRGASLYAPALTNTLGVQRMREWIEGNHNDR